MAYGQERNDRLPSITCKIEPQHYYVANELTKQFVSSVNVNTSSRLCMASSVAGHRCRKTVTVDGGRQQS